MRQMLVQLWTQQLCCSYFANMVVWAGHVSWQNLATPWIPAEDKSRNYLSFCCVYQTALLQSWQERVCVLHCRCFCCKRGVVHFADELQHVGECRSYNMFDIFCSWAIAFTQQVLSFILTHTFLSPSINQAPENKPKLNLKHCLS